MSQPAAVKIIILTVRRDTRISARSTIQNKRPRRGERGGHRHIGSQGTARVDVATLRLSPWRTPRISYIPRQRTQGIQSCIGFFSRAGWVGPARACEHVPGGGDDIIPYCNPSVAASKSLNTTYELPL
jgi:hypothetical protein